MMDVPTYRLRNVRAEHATRLVLDLPALDIRSGHVTAIVGPNGAGKTTLLRVLAGLQAPTAGGIELHGRPMSYRGRELTALRRQATLIAQSPLLFRRSVHANVAYGLRMRRLAADERLDAALAAVGLASLAQRPAWKLSGGEAQRVAIARALAIDPLVYLFDEPTANVDRQHVGVIESLILKLGASGKTVILTTHNLEQAYRLGDSIVSLTEGRLAPFPLANLLHGATARVDEHNYFFTDGLRIEIADGATAASIAVDPEDIVVSQQPLQSSARNSFPGRVVKVERDERGVMVTIDCGRPLIARITRHSYEEMGLSVGMPVYVTFKSSAIHVLDVRPAASDSLS